MEVNLLHDYQSSSPSFPLTHGPFLQSFFFWLFEVDFLQPWFLSCFPCRSRYIKPISSWNKIGYNSPIPISSLSDKNSTSWESGNLEIEKSGEQVEEDQGENEWPIIYHYLTYETELLVPSLTTQGTGCPLSPEYPNLSEYQNPFEWRESRKRWITWLSCVCTAATTFTAGAYSPGTAQMSKEWHVSNVAILVGICTLYREFCGSFHGSSTVLRDQWSETSLYCDRLDLRSLPAVLRRHTIISWHARCRLLRWCRRFNFLDNG